MIVKENQVYKAAMQFCRGFDEKLPEAVIFGYAKLLSMDEAQVRAFVPDDCMEDFETAHKWFSDNKLDLNLIKSGLLLLVQLIPAAEAKERSAKFEEFTESDKKKVSSADILKKASDAVTYLQKESFPLETLSDNNTTVYL